MELQNVSIAFISRFHFHYSPHSTDRKWCLFAIQKITKAIFATPTKQFLLADEEFSSKTHITQQHGITECECVYLTFSFSLFTSFNRQEVMFVSDSKDNKSYLRDTNKTIFASRWRVFIKKKQITEQHGITELEYCVYLTFSFSLFTSFNRQEVMFVCDSKDIKSKLRDTNETIFASRWRVFFKKPTYLSSMELQNVSIAFISRFHFRYSPHSTDRRWCLFPIQKITKAIFATPTKQLLLADEEFSLKKPNNWAAWNYRTWVLRLSHVFIFVIHLIQQTGSDVCLWFERYQKQTSRHQRNNFC